ncbi:hypothetical protein FXW07_17235 [Methanosarcina sp. DH1]|jgi:hypothetical protein|uniref:hypothetical protein n=1 Tax=Methanosarcina sp. DH1 TaxID=2605695 RepID=UPI001E5BB36D|nr:hypothetical protein [Methanosarcina sp. DH1]MCC4768291.1 hypothetical protein [Methanosarcina sp. DH1]
MSGKKSLIIVAGICLLLVGIIILNPFMQQNSPTNKEENNSENKNNSEEENNSESASPNSFFINNWGNANHEVTVELLNSKNNSVFSESYTSVPGEPIEDQFPVTPVTGGQVVVTLDNNITRTQPVSEDLTDLVLYIDIDMIASSPLDLTTVLP